MLGTGRSVVRVGLLVVLVAATAGNSAAAQESRLIGTWEGTAKLANVPPEIAMRWTFEADDGTVTGTWTGEAEGESHTSEASDIWVNGDAFGFTVSVVEGGDAGTLTFEGALSEDEVSGTFHVHADGMPETLVGTFSGRRATDPGPSG